MQWREADGVRWLEAELPDATAAFSTRIGGVSAAPFDGLNLGLLTDDQPGAVAENRERLAAALGFPPSRIAVGKQVHGAELIDRQAPLRYSMAGQSGTGEQGKFDDRDAEAPEVDGHLTAEPVLPLLVFVADCVPVALSGPGGVAMLHCGWRGLAAGIVARGAAAVGATAAAVGPSIGPCCYEVGPEVLDAFSDLGAEVTRLRMLDLPAVARRRLGEAGVEMVETSGLCTSCDPELFFSHRRDAGRTGRQAGLVWRHGENG